jgi:hypothetical protein
MNNDNFKPINTFYNGYYFRSRLEARWAVFFDTLKVKYEYEPEGFEINRTKYLPDFWLPEQDFWVEIKGKEPTYSEKMKAALLAKGSKKNVFMSVGNPWLQTHEIEEYKAKFKTPEYRIIGFLSDHASIKSPLLEEFTAIRLNSLAEFLKEKREEGYKFSRSVPEFENTESVISLLLELDNEYYLQKHGKAHPSHEYCDTDEKLLWAIINEKLLPDVFTAVLDKKFTHPRLVNAYYAARIARFEYGESPTNE